MSEAKKVISLREEDESVTTFIDYIQPPSPQPPPPAKYKLWLIILILVFFAEWFAKEAGFTEALGRSGWLSPTAALFFTLAIIVFVLTFATLDLFVAAFTFHIRGHAYGVGPWLKQGRFVWIHKQQNILAESVACVVKILEDGFSMFDYSPPPEVLSDYDNEFSCPIEDCRTQLKIEHRIDASKLKEYQQWARKIDKAAKRYARGLMDLRRSEIEITMHGEVFDEEIGQTINQSVNGILHTICLTFENLESLNEWMTSNKRQKLIRELEPLLAAPDLVQIQRDRRLADAFTDLLIRQGESVPTLTPKKWKVWWLTTIGLFFTQLWTIEVMPYYYAQWELDTSHERLQGFVAVLLSTFLNSYVLTPLLLFLFSNWVRRKETENDTRQPWKTFNDGSESIWAKAAMTIALYGGFAVAWAVKGDA